LLHVAPEGHMERRKRPRLQLRLNVEFSSPAGEAGGFGITDNISAGGVYFLTPDWQGLKMGQSLALRLSGTSNYDDWPVFRTLGCKATVLRLDVPPEQRAPHAKAGVAMRFDERPRVDVYGLSA
jgi:hypothetical protein